MEDSRSTPTGFGHRAHSSPAPVVAGSLDWYRSVAVVSLKDVQIGGKAARRRDGCEAGEIWVSIGTILSLQPETVMPSAAKTLDAIGELAILSFGASGPLAQRQSN